MNDMARFVLAIIFSLAVVIGCFAGKISADVIVGFAGVVITYYFEERSRDKEREFLKKEQNNELS